jgi:hypothetical protein
MPGVADQNDFGRVLNSAGLSYINKADYTKYLFKYVVVKFEMEEIPVARYLMLRPSTSEIYPIFVARMICTAIGMKYFDTRVLALVFGILFIISMVIIYKYLSPKNIFAKALLAVGLFLIFYDSNYIIWFNSLYGEPMIYISFALFIAANLIAINNINNLNFKHIGFLIISSLFLLGSKLQCIPILPIVIFVVFRYLFLNNKKYSACFIVAFLTFYCAGYYYDVGHHFGTNKSTLYNSIFYGLLMDSPDPKKDLIDLGLNPDLVVDKGKHCFLDEKEYTKYYPYNEITDKEFFSKISSFKIAKFYLTHPNRLYTALQFTAKNAYNTGTFLGKYQYGMPQNYDHNIRNYYWSKLRLKYSPESFVFIFWLFLVAFLIPVYEYFQSKDLQKRLRIELFWLLLIVAVIQFPMPYILNGHADVEKQLYLFNAVYDIIIFVAIYYFFVKLSGLFKRYKTANTFSEKQFGGNNNA